MAKQKHFEEASPDIQALMRLFAHESNAVSKGSSADHFKDGRTVKGDGAPTYTSMFELYHFDDVWKTLTSDATPPLEDPTLIYRYRPQWLTLQQKKGNHAWYVMVANQPRVVECVWWTLRGNAAFNQTRDRRTGQLLMRAPDWLQAERFSLRKGVP